MSAIKQTSNKYTSIINIVTQTLQQSMSSLVAGIQDFQPEQNTNIFATVVEDQPQESQEKLSPQQKKKIAQLDKKQKQLTQALSQLQKQRYSIINQDNPEQTKIKGKNNKILNPNSVTEEYFHQEVNRIAQEIRSKIKKNPLSSTPKNLSAFNGPKLSPLTVRKRNTFNFSSFERQGQVVQENSHKIAKKIVRKLLNEIIANSLKQYEKKKNKLALDPIKHKYPVTSFRKRILMEEKGKITQKLKQEVTKQNTLTKRREIFEKSRYHDKP